jgi:hypothetical protein
LTTLHVELLGSAFQLQAPDDVLGGELRRLWLPLLSEPREVDEQFRFRVASTARGWTAWQGSTVLGSRHDVPALLALLTTHLNGAAIDASRDLVLHAGAVARDGGVTALAAVSGGGKTTLTAACVSLGWEYVTDEALCLRPDGTVVPYPKPLTMSSSSRTLLGLHAARADADGEWLTTVDDLHGHLPGAGGLRLAEVVLLDRSDDRGSAGPELVQLHASDLLTRLLPLSFNHYKRPASSVELLARAALASRAWTLRYTDARAAAALLDDAFAQSSSSDAPLDSQERRSSPA